MLETARAVIGKTIDGRENDKEKGRCKSILNLSHSYTVHSI